MTRIYKQQKRRAISPRRPSFPQKKTGKRKDNLPMGYKKHDNAAEGKFESKVFIPKIY